MEHKTFTASLATKIHEGVEGIVTAIFAVFGNIDSGGDKIHPGAFAKTFHERGHKVKVTDSHRTETGLAVIATIKELRELGHEDLPPELLAQYPEATGGAQATMQFLMDTFAGKEMFIRIKAGALDEWSFAYDPLDLDFETVMIDGEEQTIRNLRTIKLYELGPVIFGMNQATTTTDAKADGEAIQAKPWATFPVADEWCVFRIDDQSERMGDSLGCHATEAEADAQVRALFASEEAGKEEMPDNETKAENLSARVARVRDAIDDQFNPPNGPWDWWAREVFDEFVQVSFSGGEGDTEFFQIPYTMDAEGVVTFAPRIDWVSGSFEFVPDNAPAPDVRAADTDQGDEKAGPVQPPTSEVTLAEVDVMLAEIQMELLEVE